MEKPTYTAIDYNSKENKVIEERIRNYYLPVKNVLETVRDRRINIPNSPGGLRIEGRIWYRMPLENLEGHEYLLGTAFWFPVSKEYNAERIKILECALEDLERIKREGEPKLPPLTFEEPKIYP